MKHVLVTVSRGIIEQVVFFENPQIAIKALSRYVEEMNVEYDDAALYDTDGMVANAKHFLDDNDEYFENKPLIAEVSGEKDKNIFLIVNPRHHLGFMVASPDDPLGYINPVEALSELGQMRQDAGNHLKLYRVAPVYGAMAERSELEKYITDLEIDDFDYSDVEEYLG